MRQFDVEISDLAQSFPWNTLKERCAQMVASGRFTYVEIADELKIHPRTITNWSRRPAFQKRVEEHLRIWRNRIMLTGIADRTRRIQALDDRWSRMKRVIEERAADPTMAAVPGGTTGLLVRDVKQVPGTGKFVAEFAVDTGLLKEMRAHEEQAARELGQWTEKRDVSVTDCTWTELAREVAAEGIDGEAPLELTPQAES